MTSLDSILPGCISLVRGTKSVKAEIFQGRDGGCRGARSARKRLARGGDDVKSEWLYLEQARLLKDRKGYEHRLLLRGAINVIENALEQKNEDCMYHSHSFESGVTARCQVRFAGVAKKHLKRS